MRNTVRPSSFCLLLTLANLAQWAISQETPPPDIRQTATVAAIEKAQPAVAAVYAFDKEGRGTGSGSVIDPRGYILTAKHLLRDKHIVLLGGRPPLQANLIGAMPEFDVAILKLGKQAFNRPASPAYPRAALPPDFVLLGVDREVRAGETVINIGSPGGRGIVSSQGIVSAVAFVGVNPLSLATQSSTAFDEKLQFDAASNPGNSGGPLINLLGQQIGMAVSGIHSEEGIHFALPPKTIRRSIPAILNSELRHRYVSGISIDPQLASVVVTEVASDSPASDANIRIGDQIISINGRQLRDPIDWEFTRYGWRPEDRVELGIKRAQQSLSVSITLAIRVGQAGVDIEKTEPGLLTRFAPYDSRIPDPLDDNQKPAGPPSVSATVSAQPESLNRQDHYELVFDGLLKVNQAGVYRLGIRSDDGSKLFVHDKLLIDNNGNHGPITRTSWVDLQPGLHPFRIEFYEDEGEQLLEFLMADGDQDLEPVPADRLFHEVDASSEKTDE